MLRISGYLFVLKIMNYKKNIAVLRTKVSNSIKKELNWKPVYNKSFLKTKTRSYGHEATGFHDKEVPKVGSNYTCLAVILLDLFLKRMKIFIHKCF